MADDFQIQELKIPTEGYTDDADTAVSAVMDEVNTLRKLEKPSQTFSTLEEKIPKLALVGQNSGEGENGESANLKKEFAIAEGLDKLKAKTIEAVGSKLPALNKTESLLVGEALRAIKTNEPKQVMHALRALAEQSPESASAVLQHVRAHHEAGNNLRQVSFVTGRDENGNTYVQMSISQAHGFGKSAGQTIVSIASNGEVAGSIQNTAFERPKPIDAGSAMRIISSMPLPEQNWKFKKQ